MQARDADSKSIPSHEVQMTQPVLRRELGFSRLRRKRAA